MVHIDLQEVAKTFGAGEGRVEAVKNVSLQINQGEIFGIIGFSGAGKSTLVRCINLLERPTDGKVIVGGTELTVLDEKQLRTVRKKIGMIFQHFNLFRSRTVFQNVAYPLWGSGLSKKEVEEKVSSLLELVDLSDKKLAYPSQLSGGQKQRVAIARALANDPDVLLCDEATSALDPQTTGSILKLLRMLNEKLSITIVIITHEMSVVKEICRRVAVMDKGEIIEQGDVFSIFSSPQAEVTKDFIATTSNLQKIHTLLQEGSPVVRIGADEIIVQLTYVEKAVSTALVSALSRNYAIDVNILISSLEIIQDVPLGGLVAIFSGKRSDIEAAIGYLIDKNVKVEVIADGKNHTESTAEFGGKSPRAV